MCRLSYNENVAKLWEHHESRLEWTTGEIKLEVKTSHDNPRQLSRDFLQPEIPARCRKILLLPGLAGIPAKFLRRRNSFAEIFLLGLQE